MDVEYAADEARVGLERVADAMADSVADARDEIRTKTDRAMDVGRDLCGRATDHAQELAGSVDSMIDDRPYVAIALAAVAGVAVGLIIGVSLGARD
jgi:ElaB/YqjD/DUF883 family membrane-anchored ribosome-binding protein